LMPLLLLLEEGEEEEEAEEAEEAEEGHRSDLILECSTSLAGSTEDILASALLRLRYTIRSLRIVPWDFTPWLKGP